ncbi:hypothetical protein ACFQGW_03070 [Xanthomonas theicola]|uniref:hypothetical protein n=1 Tax=Xanthomonas theicola TaxID=56464 RepID=UPI003613D47A
MGGAKGAGEPHYRLPSGRILTTQRAGEFWLLDASDGTRIQVRQSPWRESRSVSAIAAVAAQVDAHRVHIDVDGRVLIDGKPVAWQRKFVQYPIGRDTALGLWGNGRLHPITIGPGESRTYRIDANRGNKTVYLHVYTHDLSCLGESDFDGATPGLQVFNTKGVAVSKAVEICSDTMSDNVEPGDYYLVVQGANTCDPVAFKVDAFAY